MYESIRNYILIESPDLKQFESGFFFENIILKKTIKFKVK